MQDYVVRHEIIALHLAAVGRAEFYPSCTESSLAVSKRGCSAKTSPSRTHTTTTTRELEATIRAYTVQSRSIPHFPGPLMLDLQCLWTGHWVSCHVVVAMRDLIAIIHRESRSKPTNANGFGYSSNQWCSRHWTRFAHFRTLLSRCGMGVVQQTLHELHACLSSAVVS